jgi:hypothetical protein
MPPFLRLIVLSLFVCLAAAALAGCESVYMKGTPYYAGEFSVKQIPEVEGFNLWPLVYSRDPVLSVLWPLAELTDDHYAIRPLWSVYKLDKEAQEYSLLWPLTNFDVDEDRYRVFPYFWGEDEGHDYSILFPLWWYEEDAHTVLFPLFGYWGGESNTFISLPYSWSGDEANGFRAVIGPFFSHSWSQREDGKKSWRIHAPFPIVSINGGDEEYGYGLFPLFGRDHGASLPLGKGPLPLFQYATSSHGQRHALWPLYEASGWVFKDQTEGPTMNYAMTGFGSLLFFAWESHELVRSGDGVSVTVDGASHQLWPLYKYRADRRRNGIARETDFDLLWFLYNYDSRVTQRDKGAESRMSSSVLWRLFRWERGGDGAVDVDLFFIPIWRGGAARKADLVEPPRRDS